MVSYGAGLANVRPRDYFAGTFLGSLPGILIYAYLADSIIEGVTAPSDAKGRIAIAAASLAALVITTNLIARRFRRRGQRVNR